MTLLLAFLAFFTLGAVCVFGYISSVKTAERLHADTPPSTLAADGPAKRKNNAEKMGDV